MYLVVIASILSIFATCVMSYISMATPIGPWIAPTLVLCGTLLFHLIRPRNYEHSLALVTCAGSVGGITATALAFSFPTLHFLDQTLFATLLASPLRFIGLITALSCVAGWFGIWIANIFEHAFIWQDKLEYPIGNMVHSLIATHHSIKKAYELAGGFIVSILIALLQDVLHMLIKSITVIKAFSWHFFLVPSLIVDVSPLLWAIGFVTGHVIAIPLAVGALSRILITQPINTLFFANLTYIEFNFAFCTGIILYTTAIGLYGTAKKMYQTAAKTTSVATPTNWFIKEGIATLLCVFCFLTYFNFPLMCQAYVVIFTFMCTRQILLIAGRIGLAPLGTFATFVMVPALFFFNLTNQQLVIIATFVEICGGVAADILFGRKVGFLQHLPKNRLKLFQYFGLIISSITAGIIFWLLIHKFGIGSCELIAIKAHSRALLIQSVHHVNLWAIIPGFVFGYLVQQCRINPTLVLSGLLMPLSISIGLIIGALCTLATRVKEEWFPFWSGIFAAQSMWMLLRALVY